MIIKTLRNFRLQSNGRRRLKTTETCAYNSKLTLSFFSPRKGYNDESLGKRLEWRCTAFRCHFRAFKGNDV